MGARNAGPKQRRRTEKYGEKEERPMPADLFWRTDARYHPPRDHIHL